MPSKKLIPIEQIKKELQAGCDVSNQYWIDPKSYYSLPKHNSFMLDSNIAYSKQLLQHTNFLFDYMGIKSAWVNQFNLTSFDWSMDEAEEWNNDIYNFANIYYWLNKYSDYDFLPESTNGIQIYNEDTDKYIGTHWNMPIEAVNVIPSSKDVEKPDCLDISIQFKVNVQEYGVAEEPYVDPHNNPIKYITSHRSAVDEFNPFGLKSRTLNLPEKASDYYLLHLLDIAGEGPYVDSGNSKKMLEHITNDLDDQFRRYTDMVIGGELRHFQLERSGNQTLAKEMLPMYEMMRDRTLLHDTTSRHQAWIGWYYIRQEYGTLALRWAEKLFRNGSWQTNYGGEAWSKITQVLLHRELGKLTAHTFVDSCWGLHHNTGSYFNKWWDTHYLLDTLNENLAGEYCSMTSRASSYIKSLMHRYISNIELCQCSNCDRERRYKIEDTRKRTYFAQRIADILHNYTEGEKIYG